MAKIVVLDGAALNPGDLSWDALAVLGELTVFDRTRPEDVAGRAAGAEIVLTNKAVVSAAAMERLTALRMVSVLATGYNVVDVSAARARGVVVSNVPDYGTNTVAQYVMALLLELCHQVGRHADEVRDEGWTRAADWTFWRTPQVELHGLTMGIVGYGRIGRRVAELARAFGMRVIYNSRGPREEEGFRTLEELFAEADVVSLHCALTAENAGMVHHALLHKMKPTAFLINTARGGLVVEKDLADALNAGVLAGAAVDVLGAEPPMEGNALVGAKHCLVTPHMAWAAKAARQRIMDATVGNVKAFLAGTARNVVG